MCTLNMDLMCEGLHLVFWIQGKNTLLLTPAGVLPIQLLSPWRLSLFSVAAIYVVISLSSWSTITQQDIIGSLFWALGSCSLRKCSFLGFYMAPSAKNSPVQMGDVCHRMVDRKQKSKHIQSLVSMGLSNCKSTVRSWSKTICWNFPTTAPKYCVSLSDVLLFHYWNYSPNLLVGLLFQYG